jgi:hypothetical protein
MVAQIVPRLFEIVVLHFGFVTQRRKTSHPPCLVFIVPPSLASLPINGAHLIVPAKNGLNGRSSRFPVSHRRRSV